MTEQFSQHSEEENIKKEEVVSGESSVENAVVPTLPPNPFDKEFFSKIFKGYLEQPNRDLKIAEDQASIFKENFIKHGYLVFDIDLRFATTEHPDVNVWNIIYEQLKPILPDEVKSIESINQFKEILDNLKGEIALFFRTPEGRTDPNDPAYGFLMDLFKGAGVQIQKNIFKVAIIPENMSNYASYASVWHGGTYQIEIPRIKSLGYSQRKRGCVEIDEFFNRNTLRNPETNKVEMSLDGRIREMIENSDNANGAYTKILDQINKRLTENKVRPMKMDSLMELLLEKEFNFAEHIILRVSEIMKKNEKQTLALQTTVLYDVDETIGSNLEEVWNIRPIFRLIVEFLRDKYPQLKIGLASTRSEDIIHKQLEDSAIPYSLHEIQNLIDKDAVRGVAARNPARFDDGMANAEKLDLSIYPDPSPEGQKNFHEKLLAVLFDSERLREMKEDLEGKDKKEIYSRLEIILQRIAVGKKMLDNGEAGVTILVDNDEIANLFDLLLSDEIARGDRKKGVFVDGYKLLGLEKYRDRINVISCGPRGVFSKQAIFESLARSAY